MPTVSFDSRIETYRHIQQVQRILGLAIADLQHRQQAHDQSKLASPEVEVFDEFTPKLKGSTYGSDEYKGFLKEMGVGLAHHYAANSHHPEHFQPQLCDCVVKRADGHAGTRPRVYKHPKMNEEEGRELDARDLVALPDCMVCYSIGWRNPDIGGRGILGMNLLDLLEMLCDWKAATMQHADGDIRKSIEINQKRFGYSDELKAILLNTLPVIEN